VDLGHAKPVTDVVVAGASNATRVEASTDGRSWETVATIPAGRGNVVSTGPLVGVRARYLRVTSQDLAGIEEVTAYG
jgi:hypothetical protein